MKILEESATSKTPEPVNSIEKVSMENVQNLIESTMENMKKVNPSLAESLQKILEQTKALERKKNVDQEFLKTLKEIREFSVKTANIGFWDVWRNEFWEKAMKESSTPLTLLIVILCTLIYIATWVFSSETLNEMFPAHKSELWSGKIWKGFSCLFFHWNIFHLLFNLQVFTMTARNLEMRFGHWILLWILLTSGYVGTVAQSNLGMGNNLRHDTAIVGLSGAACGLIGFGMIAARAFTWTIPQLSPRAKISMRYVNRMLWGNKGNAKYWLWSILGLGVVSEYFHFPIATWAHLGGLAWGALVGILMRTNGPAVAGLASFAIFMGFMGMNFQPKRSPSWNAFTSTRFIHKGDVERAEFYLKRVQLEEDEWSKVLLALCYANSGNDNGAVSMAKSVDTTKILTKETQPRKDLTTLIGTLKYLPWFNIDGNKTISLFNNCFKMNSNGTIILVKKPSTEELTMLIRDKPEPRSRSRTQT